MWKEIIEFFNSPLIKSITILEMAEIGLFKAAQNIGTSKRRVKKVLINLICTPITLGSKERNKLIKVNF